MHIKLFIIKHFRIPIKRPPNPHICPLSVSEERGIRGGGRTPRLVVRRPRLVV